MTEVRINQPVQVPNDPDEAERFTRRLAERVHAPLAARVGSIEWRRGDDTGVDWQAEAWLDDGTLLILGVSPIGQNVSLYLANPPTVRSPAESPRWTYPLLLALLFAGSVGGLLWESVLVGAGITIAGVLVWVEIDVARGIVADRTAKPPDEQAWAQTLSDALLAARN
jgi:hypothetical protein